MIMAFALIKILLGIVLRNAQNIPINSIITRLQICASLIWKRGRYLRKDQNRIWRAADMKSFALCK